MQEQFSLKITHPVVNFLILLLVKKVKSFTLLPSTHSINVECKQEQMYTNRNYIRAPFSFFWAEESSAET